MAAVSPRAALLACAWAPDGDVAEGALWLAAEECEGVDVGLLLALLDRLGEELRSTVGGDPSSLPDLVAARQLSGLLGDRLRLRQGPGDDVRCHYLHTVVARGRAIPIACAALWIGVGRRAGLRVEGVGLPGHFVVRVGQLLVDAVGGGEPLDEAGARRLAASGFGGRVPERLDPRWVRAATTREMLARMSRNLRACHLAAERMGPALRAADRCVALLPLDPVERRERGLVRIRVGLAWQALRDLRAYLAAVPDAPDRAEVERVVARAIGMLN